MNVDIFVVFQSTALAFDVVNEVNVYTCTGQPLRSDIANMVKWMLNEDFTTTYNGILLWPNLYIWVRSRNLNLEVPKARQSREFRGHAPLEKL